MTAAVSSCPHGTPPTHACSLCWRGGAPPASWTSGVVLTSVEAEHALQYLARARAAVEEAAAPHLPRATYVAVKMAGEYLRELDELVRGAVAR